MPNVAKPPSETTMSGTNPTQTERLSDEEWLRRFDARITERSGYEDSYSHATGAKDTIEQFREAGDIFENDPEDAADEEMSYWDDDGE